MNEYLDETQDAELRREVEKHVNECPNCWVVFDTCKKTLKVFKGTEPQVLPGDVHSRLMERLQKKMSEKHGPCH